MKQTYQNRVDWIWDDRLGVDEGLERGGGGGTRIELGWDGDASGNEDTNLDANQLDYAQTAHASGKDLIALINEVLDQAKIESGRLELEAVPFDLRADLDKV
ncbi:hypothetical protein ACH5RR_036262 [Cinchona calisaya]|uniref:histidine kinase n=1 Tax=Cinchona calisaya TaxID=153742 RepID=A0ABD2Y864_9GENT